MPQAGRVGDDAHCPADSHGCSACPHDVAGPATAGSSNVIINDKAALRVGDPGVHSACCGGNSWSADEGSSCVLVNGKRAHRTGDAVTHCGGSGVLVGGSPNVLFGDRGGESSSEWTHWFELHIEHADGREIDCCSIEVVAPDGQKISDSSKLRRFGIDDIVSDGQVEVSICLKRSRES